MRKVILGSTALVAAGMLAGSGAPAQGAEPITLSVGGYYQVYFTLRAQSDVDNEGPGAGESLIGNDEEIRNIDVTTDAEVFFNGSTTLDNGITVGVSIQLEGATTGDQIDEHFLYFSGNFGRLEVGANDGAANTMHYGAPSIQQLGIDDVTFFAIAPTSGNAVGSPQAVTITGISGDANKITYFTPRFSPGFQFGFSFTPEICDEVPSGGIQGTVVSDTEDDNFDNVIDFGMNFLRQFGDVDLAWSIGYQHAFREGNGTVIQAAADDNATCAASNAQTSARLCINDPDFESGRDAFTTGFNIGFSGWTVGGGFKIDDFGLERESTQIDTALAVTYGAGPWLVGTGVAYVTNEDGQTDTNNKDSDKVVAAHISGAYTLGPGVTAVAGVQGTKGWGDDGNENFDGVVFSIGTALSF